jgi:hypothetical protein
VGGENGLISIVSANRVVAGGWMGGCVVVSGGGQKRFIFEEILTCVTARHIKTVT